MFDIFQAAVPDDFVGGFGLTKPGDKMTDGQVKTNIKSIFKYIYKYLTIFYNCRLS